MLCLHVHGSPPQEQEREQTSHVCCPQAEVNTWWTTVREDKCAAPYLRMRHCLSPLERTKEVFSPEMSTHHVQRTA
jgi:hypothetical protein